MTTPRNIVIRVALVACAAAAIVFCAIWLSDFSASRSARHVVLSPNPTRAQLDHGIREADRATRVNPSTDPDITKFGLLVRSGRDAEARRVFDSIVRREPDNAQAWFGLAIATQRTDARAFKRAIARLHQLNPLIGPAR